MSQITGGLTFIDLEGRVWRVISIDDRRKLCIAENHQGRSKQRKTFTLSQVIFLVANLTPVR